MSKINLYKVGVLGSLLVLEGLTLALVIIAVARLGTGRGAHTTQTFLVSCAIIAVSLMFVRFPRPFPDDWPNLKPYLVRKFQVPVALFLVVVVLTASARMLS